MNQPTTVRVREVALPDVDGASAGTMALLTLDNGADHTRPTVLDEVALTSLGEALDTLAPRIAAGEIDAVGVTGKPYFFAAGADLKKIGTIRDRKDACAIAQFGHAQLRRLTGLGVPTFAFINGLALGGGLEIALHCTYRTISRTAVVGLPETMLGLIPGWGGAYLLPRLIGPQAAIQVIVANPLQQNKTLKGAAAAELGIVDAVFDPAEFLVDSLRWSVGVLANPDRVRRTDHTADPTWQPVVKIARDILRAKVGDSAPAPHRALDLIAGAQTADADAGFAAEDEALADLVMSDQMRAGLYAFDLVQRRAKKPPAGVAAELARPVTYVGVVGAGLMASQLALLFARQLDVPVVMSDLDAERVAKGLEHVRAEIAKQAKSGRLSPDRANRLVTRITGTVGMDGFADADFVIEAVFEELEVKRTVFAGLEQVVGPECVLATNTSSLSVAAMAEGLQHPERVIGFHFFNPVAVMPLLEVVHAETTDDATIATACAVAKGLRKTIIRVADSPSFVVNRLLGRMMSEVGAIVDAGTPIEVAERSLVGMAPMPPFQLIDLVGPAVALHNTESLAAAFPGRFGVPESVRAVVAAGKRAFYLLSGPNERPTLDPEVRALLPQPEQPVVLAPAEIRDKVLDALADEAGRMLADGVVTEPQDLDLAMITGAGFTFWNGGLLPLLDRSGASERMAGRRFLPAGMASL
jgi:3-hydroxyacyl-CoA dehydrogenase/enoyl-CoA hydratase/carnithine racemase